MKFNLPLFEKKGLTWLLLIVGIVFFIFAILPDRQSSLIQNDIVGQVRPMTGQTDLLTDNLAKRQKISESTSFRSSDSIQTDEIGKSILSLESGHDVEVQPSSLITIEKNIRTNQQQLVLILKSGQIQIKKDGRPNSLLIAKNGKRILSTEYEKSDLSTETFSSNPEQIEHASDVTLSEQEVSSTLAQSRSLFFKCYTRLLQKNQANLGEVSLSFSIQKSGHVKDIDVITEVGDQEFKSCLQQVVERIEFRSFNGPPISTVFPLKFEN